MAGRCRRRPAPHRRPKSERLWPERFLHPRSCRLRGMTALAKLLFLVLVLGTAMQRGWLQAGTGYVVAALGGPVVLEPQAPLEGVVLLRRLARTAGDLPDPWYSLMMMALGGIALVLAIAITRGLVRMATWFC